MRKHGVQRRVVSRDELQIEPAFRAYGGTSSAAPTPAPTKAATPCAFTQQLAKRCAERGVQFLYGQDVLRLERSGNAIDSVAIRANQYSAGGQRANSER